jgi:hypothetical protein
MNLCTLQQSVGQASPSRLRPPSRSFWGRVPTAIIRWAPGGHWDFPQQLWATPRMPLLRFSVVRRRPLRHLVTPKAGSTPHASGSLLGLFRRHVGGLAIPAGPG